MISDLATPAKNMADAASVTTIIATFVGWLPHIAALLSIIWMAIRIWETDTVQKMIHSVAEYKAKKLIQLAGEEAKGLISTAKDAAVELKQQETKENK